MLLFIKNNFIIVGGSYNYSTQRTLLFSCHVYCTQTSSLIIKADKYRIGYWYQPISVDIYWIIGISYIGASLLSALFLHSHA